MEKKVSYGIYTGTVVGAGLMAILGAVVGPFMILSLSLLPYNNTQPSTQSALILGIVIGAIVGAVLGTITGMIGAAVLIHLAMGNQANRAGTSRSVVLQQWEVKQFVVLGAIGGGTGITILIICPFLYTLI